MPQPVEHEDVHDDNEEQRDSVAAHEEDDLERGVGELLRGEAAPVLRLLLLLLCPFQCRHLFRGVGHDGGVSTPAALDLQVVREPDGHGGGGDKDPQDEGGAERVRDSTVREGGHLATP